MANTIDYGETKGSADYVVKVKHDFSELYAIFAMDTL